MQLRVSVLDRSEELEESIDVAKVATEAEADLALEALSTAYPTPIQWLEATLWEEHGGTAAERWELRRIRLPGSGWCIVHGWPGGGHVPNIEGDVAAISNWLAAMGFKPSADQVARLPWPGRQRGAELVTTSCSPDRYIRSLLRKGVAPVEVVVELVLTEGLERGALTYEGRARVDAQAEALRLSDEEAARLRARVEALEAEVRSLRGAPARDEAWAPELRARAQVMVDSATAVADAREVIDALWPLVVDVVKPNSNSRSDAKVAAPDRPARGYQRDQRWRCLGYDGHTQHEAWGATPAAAESSFLRGLARYLVSRIAEMDSMAVATAKSLDKRREEARAQAELARRHLAAFESWLGEHAGGRA